MRIRHTVALFIVAAISITTSWAVGFAEDSDQGGAVVFEGKGQTISVLDGDTLWIGIHQIRLHGIDAVEPTQTCELDGKIQPCAEDARKALEILARNPDLKCLIHFDKEGRPQLKFNRYIATCYVGTMKINERLLADGFALAANKQSTGQYRQIEREAKAKQIGLHRLKFEKPWEYRRRQWSKKDCEEE